MPSNKLLTNGKKCVVYPLNIHTSGSTKNINIVITRSPTTKYIYQFWMVSLNLFKFTIEIP